MISIDEPPTKLRDWCGSWGDKLFYFDTIHGRFSVEIKPEINQYWVNFDNRTFRAIEGGRMFGDRFGVTVVGVFGGWRLASMFIQRFWRKINA